MGTHDYSGFVCISQHKRKFNYTSNFMMFQSNTSSSSSIQYPAWKQDLDEEMGRQFNLIQVIPNKCHKSIDNKKKSDGHYLKIEMT